MKPSDKLIKEWIKDEKKSSKEYIKYGLPNIAKDERKHSRILKNVLRGRK